MFLKKYLLNAKLGSVIKKDEQFDDSFKFLKLFICKLYQELACGLEKTLSPVKKNGNQLFKKSYSLNKPTAGVETLKISLKTDNSLYGKIINEYMATYTENIYESNRFL